MDIKNINTNIQFKARAGKNLLKYVCQNDFGNDKTKTDRFAKLFEQAFADITEDSTIIDIDRNKNMIFSNSLFPKIKYTDTSAIVKSYKNLAKNILNSCTTVILRGEYALFKNIIIKKINLGKSVEEITKFVEQNFKNHKKLENFLEILHLAERAKNEFPNQKLNSYTLEYIGMKVAEENFKKNPSLLDFKLKFD